LNPPITNLFPAFVRIAVVGDMNRAQVLPYHEDKLKSYTTKGRARLSLGDADPRVPRKRGSVYFPPLYSSLAKSLSPTTLHLNLNEFKQPHAECPLTRLPVGGHVIDPNRPQLFKHPAVTKPNRVTPPDRLLRAAGSLQVNTVPELYNPEESSTL
jgi:hypothetical protein